MTTDSPLTITAASASILYSAINTALIVTRARLKLSAEPYKVAIGLQIAAYESERANLARAFPVLSDGSSKAYPLEKNYERSR